MTDLDWFEIYWQQRLVTPGHVRLRTEQDEHGVTILALMNRPPEIGVYQAHPAGGIQAATWGPERADEIAGMLRLAQPGGQR